MFKKELFFVVLIYVCYGFNKLNNNNVIKYFMQIREIDLKELDTAYGVVKEIYPSYSYKDFEDLIYDMRHIDYKMFGVFDDEKLLTYAGVAIMTTLKDKRHLRVFEFQTSHKYSATLKYDKIMFDYLNDFSKTAMCEKVVYED
jgi:hypothetical protein